MAYPTLFFCIEILGYSIYGNTALLLGEYQMLSQYYY